MTERYKADLGKHGRAFKQELDLLWRVEADKAIAQGYILSADEIVELAAELHEAIMRGGLSRRGD